MSSLDSHVVNCSFEAAFPASSSTKKAGLVFAHDGSNNYYAVVIDRNAAKLALHKITSGSWGSALDSGTASISDSTAYTVHVHVKQRSVTAWIDGQSNSDFEYSSTADFGVGQPGLYADVANAQFDDYVAVDGSARDPLARHFVGSANAGVASNALHVNEEGGGEVWVQGFADDDYLVQLNGCGSTGKSVRVWGRYQDGNNGYMLSISHYGNGVASLWKCVKANFTQLDSDGP